MLDLKNKTMYEAVMDAVNDFPRGTAIYYQGKKISYSRFAKRIDRMADILSNKLNVKKGDVILIAQPNLPDALVLFYAANRIGAISNFVHPFTPFNQIRVIMQKTNTKVAFLFEQRIAKEVDKYRKLSDKIYVTRVEDDLPLLKKIIYHTFYNFKIRRKLGKWRNKFDGFNYLKDLKPSGKGSPFINNNVNDTAILLHSGSTTGDPKTICISSWNMNFLAERAGYFLDCDIKFMRGKGMLSILPSFHGFGLCMTMHAPIVNRFASILIPKFNAKEIAKTMKHICVASICGVPTVYENLLKCDEFVHSKHLKDLYVCFCGGDSMSVSLKERWDEAMKKGGSSCQVFEGYGLTEAVCVNAVNTYKYNRIGSFGKAAPDVTFRIVNEEGKEVPRGTVGEITLKSEAMMVGYFKDEENTKKAIIDGWLYTGDLGYMDEDDFIFFKQRKKRVVKVSGVGIFPTEIERLVETVPGVKKCCAIRIPDPKLQSAIKLFVVANFFDEEGMKEAIMDTCSKYLIRWAMPKEIEFRDDLPVTQLGKIDFKALQKEEDEKRGIKSEF